MKFGWPLAFVGLLGLTIPLVIHLLQKGYGHKVVVGSTRWLESDKRPRWRKLLISQPWLLLTRLLLLSLATLILAEPFIPSLLPPSSVPGWILVHPSVGQKQLKDLDLPDGPRRWLAPGFPDIGVPPPELGDHLAWSLLKEADALLAPQRFMHVVSPTDINNFTLFKPTLGRPMSWSTVSKGTVPDETTLPGTVDIVFDEDRRQDAQRVALAIESWRVADIFVTPDLSPADSKPTLSSWVVWLSRKTPPQGATEVLITDQTLPDPEMAAVKIINWVPGFNNENPEFRSALFAEELLVLFLGDQLSKPPANYQIAIDEAILTATAKKTDIATHSKNSLTWPLLWLLVVFVIERFLSVWPERVRNDT